MARNPRSSRRKGLQSPALPLLKIELQRASADCAIACLASLTGSVYEDVLVEAGKEKRLGGYPHESGLYFTNMVRIAKRLGCNLRTKSTCDFEKDEGILTVAWNERGKFTHHVVVVIKGLIFDMADATVWLPVDYKKANKAKFGSMLVPVI